MMFSFFYKLISSNYNSIHDKRYLWQYHLNKEHFLELQDHLNRSAPNVDPRDVTLYFAEWWKRKYNGGTRSVHSVYDSLPVNFKTRISQKKFYKLARQGARQLGIRWRKKDYTLYLGTLLLQGGLPLNHIEQNKGKYQDFLLAVLNSQPESVEDFSMDTSIINLLPSGSRDEIIYECCFEIVKAILEDDEDSVYYSLLDKEESLKDIQRELLVQRAKLSQRKRISKPNIYWILNFDRKDPKISLRFGFAQNYRAEDLQGFFGIETIHRSYQLFLDDYLVCTFRRTLSGRYITEWNQRKSFEWNQEQNIPNLYILYRDEQGNELRSIPENLIQHYPNLSEPSLWTSISDTEWKLNRGNSTKDTEAHLLIPEGWSFIGESENQVIYGEEFKIKRFEGEVTVYNEQDERKFITGVSSFDWNILPRDLKPDWLIKSNFTVVRSTPRIFVYDENNEHIQSNKYNVFIKPRGSNNEWIALKDFKIFPLGCVDIKIVKDGIVAYDTIYNIGSFDLIFSGQTLSQAEITTKNNRRFEMRITDSPLFDVSVVRHSGNFYANDTNKLSYQFSLNPENHKIPKSIRARIKMGAQKSLYFDLKTPFTGTRVIDSEGEIMESRSRINVTNLLGLRILKPANEECVITMKNVLRPNVKISKQIDLDSKPLIAYKEELENLFFLADSMNYENCVEIELRSKNERIIYYAYSYTDSLELKNKFEHSISLESGTNDLELFAIPLNCKSKEIRLIPIEKDSEEESASYCIDLDYKQMVIISADDESNRFLLPRFVNTDAEYIGEDPILRINRFHLALEKSGYDEEIWQEMLVYFKICEVNDLAFSTFDQIRAVGKSSRVAAKAFFFLCMNQEDPEDFIQQQIPKLERDLGFCFHWINKDDWIEAIDEAIGSICDEYANFIYQWPSIYFLNTQFEEIFAFIASNSRSDTTILNPEVQEVRRILGERVLRELPRRLPHVTSTYNIDVDNPIKLLICSGIAIAEGIKGVNQKSLWDNNELAEELRRNVQYTQYLTPDFYKNIILHVLSR